jgi:hypothetical protein
MQNGFAHDVPHDRARADNPGDNARKKNQRQEQQRFK